MSGFWVQHRGFGLCRKSLGLATQPNADPCFQPYTEAMMARDKWIENILQDFREDFKRLREAAKPVEKITKLKENCFIFRLFDLELYQVTGESVFI